MSDSVLFVAAFVSALIVSFSISAVAIRRSWSGDRRFAGLAFAPLIVMIVAPVVVLLGDLGHLGWAGIPLLAAELLVLALMGRALMRVARSTTSRAEPEFEDPSAAAVSDLMLVYLGLVLVGGVIAVVVLVAYGIGRAAGG